MQGLFTPFIPHSSSGYCQLSRIPEAGSGRSGNLGHGFSSFVISGSIKRYCGGEGTNGRNKQMLDNFGFQMLSLLPFPP